MVISESEKKVLLERLALARIAKQQKKEIKEKEAKAISLSAAAPSAAAPFEPIPIPEVVAPVVPVAPAIPAPLIDLVALHKKGKKKVCLPDDSDSEDETVLPPKKKKLAQKETAYMKIKIYREPKNTAAMQDLLAAVQDEQDVPTPEVADVPMPEPQQPQVFVRPPRLLVQQIGGRAVKSFDSDAARKDLLRRQALEFFA